MTDRAFEILSQNNETTMTEYVFIATVGSYRKSRQELKNTIVALELEDSTLHTLRPTAASRFVLSGISLYEVASILAHTNISMYNLLANDQVTQNAEPTQNDLSFSRPFRTEMSKTIRPTVYVA